jgi:hypothetical protein
MLENKKEATCISNTGNILIKSCGSSVWADMIGYLVAGTVVGTNGVAAHMLAPAVVCGTLILNIFDSVIFTERN